jgi:hypothetical protein
MDVNLQQKTNLRFRLNATNDGHHVLISWYERKRQALVKIPKIPGLFRREATSTVFISIRSPLRHFVVPIDVPDPEVAARLQQQGAALAR